MVDLLLDVHGSLQLLDYSHVREKEIRLCFGVLWLGLFGMDFSLARVREQPTSMSFLWCTRW